MAGGNSFWSFAANVDVCFKTLANWCDAHPEFLQAKNNGISKLLKFDEELGKAGVAGQLRRVSKTTRVINKDGSVTETHEYEPATFGQTFHIFTLKNRYPRLYRDKIQIEHAEADKSKKLNQAMRDVMADPELAKVAKQLAEKISKK